MEGGKEASSGAGEGIAWRHFKIKNPHPCAKDA